jgi:hypothetical protein
MPCALRSGSKLDKNECGVPLTVLTPDEQKPRELIYPYAKAK